MSVNVEGYRNESFESLESAVMETQRGRWFLEEYAKRQRSAESLAIIDILRKLETSIVSSSPVAQEPATPLKPEQMKFFKKDEDIFVEPVMAAPVFTVVAPAPVGEIKPPSENRGAKLKIQRITPDHPQDELPVAPTAPAQIPVPEPETLVAAAPDLPVEPKQRVVIIRRPASEVSEIPMVDENKPEVAA